MSVVVSIEDVGPCRKQLKVEVPAPVVEAETERVVGEFQRSARLPGFRKGKVPAGLIRSKYQEDIEQQVVERLLPRFWHQAEAEKELDPLLPPNVDEVNFQPGKALTFLASVEVRPEIELGDLEDFDLPEMEVEPTQGDMERAIEDMRRAVAEWVDTDRSAAHGDLVVGNLVALSDDEDEEASPEPQEVRFEVGDPQVWEELSLEVTGKAAGQSGEFEHQLGEGDDQQMQRFRISMEAVKERDLPAMNDELAAKVGKFESVAELEEDIRARLERAKKVDREQKRERALLDQLSERHPVELPAGVVDQEIEGMLREYGQSLASSGVDLESTEMDWQAMADQVRPQAERRVHARLLLDAVAKQTGAEVAEDEFERTLSTIARAQKSSTTAIRQELDRTGRLAGLREQMRREKALKTLMGDKPTETQGDPEPKPEGV